MYLYENFIARISGRVIISINIYTLLYPDLIYIKDVTVECRRVEDGEYNVKNSIFSLIYFVWRVRLC